MASAVPDDDDVISAINVTPLVDVVLVLLIIFMVTTEVIHESEKPRVVPVRLPVAASADHALSSGLLDLVIDRRGTLWMNGERADYGTVEARLAELRARNVEPEALISADERVSHGVVVSLMDFLRLRGVRKLAVNTRRQEIE